MRSIASVSEPALRVPRKAAFRRYSTVFLLITQCAPEFFQEVIVEEGKNGRVEGWKGEEWKGEEWKIGRVEGWKNRRLAAL
jgi:hypothetical protein